LAANEKGTGLGLSVVYSIVNSHKGYVAVHSTIDEGTKFTIYLPCCTEKAQRQVKDEPVETSHSKQRIYLIDDEDMVGDVGRKILLRLGHEVTLFNDAEAALLALTHRIDHVEIVITDDRLTTGRSYTRIR
jgi:PleD family two-component response regulator